MSYNKSLAASLRTGCLALGEASRLTATHTHFCANYSLFYVLTIPNLDGKVKANPVDLEDSETKGGDFWRV